MYKITIEPIAINDLLDIAEYYQEQGGKQLADTITERIYTQIETLKYMPSRCLKSLYSDELNELIIQKAPYKVFFKINEQKKAVYILTILHTSRDIKTLIKNKTI